MKCQLYVFFFFSEWIHTILLRLSIRTVLSSRRGNGRTYRGYTSTSFPRLLPIVRLLNTKPKSEKERKKETKRIRTKNNVRNQKIPRKPQNSYKRYFVTTMSLPMVGDVRRRIPARIGRHRMKSARSFLLIEARRSSRFLIMTWLIERHIYQSLTVYFQEFYI